MALTFFEKYNAEIEKFEKSKLYKKTYYNFLLLVKTVPIISRDLEKLLNITGVEARSLVRYARKMGVALCSSSEGYFMAKDYSDLQNTTAHLRERARAINAVADQMEKVWLTTKGSTQMRML